MGEIISGDSLLMDCLLNLYWIILIICNIYVCISNDLILDNFESEMMERGCK